MRCTTRRPRASWRTSSAQPTCSTATRRSASRAGGGSAMLRPERIRLGAADGARASGAVREVQYFGAFTRLKVDAAGALLQADLPEAPGTQPGRRLAKRCTCIGTRARCMRSTWSRWREHRAGLARPGRRAWQRRFSDLLYTRRGLLLLALRRRRCCGSASSTWARCSRCWPTPSSASTTSPARWCASSRCRTFVEIGNPANLDVVRRSVTMAVAGDAGLRGHRHSRWPTTWRATPPARRRRCSTSR